MCWLVVCLHLPVRAAGWVSEFLGRCCFAPPVEPPPEPAPRSGAKSRSRRGAGWSWFRATRVRGLWSLASVVPERRRVTPGWYGAARHSDTGISAEILSSELAIGWLRPRHGFLRPVRSGV